MAHGCRRWADVCQLPLICGWKRVGMGHASWASMREHEMRQRLEWAIRRSACPAAMSITLGLAACGGQTIERAPEVSDAAFAEATGGAGGGPVAIYAAPMPSPGSTGLGGATLYGSPMPDPHSTGSGGLYGAPYPGSTGVGGAMYMAQMPDAWAPAPIDAGSADAVVDRPLEAGHLDAAID
jgi:hypothetical protein